jgi:hypothetical protein
MFSKIVLVLTAIMIVVSTACSIVLSIEHKEFIYFGAFFPIALFMLFVILETWYRDCKK